MDVHRIAVVVRLIGLHGDYGLVGPIAKVASYLVLVDMNPLQHKNLQMEKLGAPQKGPTNFRAPIATTEQLIATPVVPRDLNYSTVHFHHHRYAKSEFPKGGLGGYVGFISFIVLLGRIHPTGLYKPK